MRRVCQWIFSTLKPSGQYLAFINSDKPFFATGMWKKNTHTECVVLLSAKADNNTTHSGGQMSARGKFYDQASFGEGQMPIHPGFNVRELRSGPSYVYFRELGDYVGYGLWWERFVYFINVYYLIMLIVVYQVVLVLLLGQRVALTHLMRGDHCIGKLADYTTQFIGDHIADFIIRNGGWVRPLYYRELWFVACIRPHQTIKLMPTFCLYTSMHNINDTKGTSYWSGNKGWQMPNWKLFHQVLHSIVNTLVRTMRLQYGNKAIKPCRTCTLAPIKVEFHRNDDIVEETSCARFEITLLRATLQVAGWWN